MKVSELQIGDWVLLDNSTPDKIKLIAKYYVVLEENCYCESSLDDIKPIPLTEDILKANGFVRSGMFMSRWWNNDDVVYADGSFDNNINISTCGTDDHAEYINIRIPHIGIGMPLYYVHELQHALRLCGLNELADSFKIGGKE